MDAKWRSFHGPHTGMAGTWNDSLGTKPSKRHIKSRKLPNETILPEGPLISMNGHSVQCGVAEVCIIK
jgi:hypothetical protein